MTKKNREKIEGLRSEIEALRLKLTWTRTELAAVENKAALLYKYLNVREAAPPRPIMPHLVKIKV